MRTGDSGAVGEFFGGRFGAVVAQGGEGYSGAVWGVEFLEVRQRGLCADPGLLAAKDAAHREALRAVGSLSWLKPRPTKTLECSRE